MEVDANLISKFIPVYPDIESSKFAYDLASKKEFRELKLGREETVPDKRGVPMLHQEIIRRYFSPHTTYDRGLLVHEMGSGKSMESCLVAEYFKYRFIDDKPRPKALVLVPNDTLIRNFKKEIVTRCTTGEYEPQFLGKQTLRRKRMFMNKAINQFYEIVSFETFLKNLPESNVLKKKYSNRVIIIDEIHVFGSRERSEGKLYQNLHRLLHVVENCVILGLTGTVIWDKTYEFASVMNLLLREEEQLPTGKKFYEKFFVMEGGVRVLKDDKKDELKEILKGKISYIRALTTSAKREEMGVVRPWMKKARIYPCGMDEFQMRYSKKAMKEEKDKGLQIESRNSNNFVFPVLNKAGKVVNGRYDSNAFNDYIQFKNGIYSFKDKRVADEIQKNLHQYSAKYAASIQFILDHPDEKVFIYNDFVSGTGGVIVFSLILEMFGFTGVRNVTTTVDRFSNNNLPKEKRFILISSEKGTINLSNQIQMVIDDLYNDPRNNNADYCQVIIGTKKISLGVTLKSTNQVHIHMPHWNFSEIDQAIFRAIRTGSHDTLPESKRFIKIYKMAVVDTKKSDSKKIIDNKGFTPKNRKYDIKGVTADLYVYRKAEMKDYSNAQIYRLIKEISFDCPFTYERNVLPSDVNESKECNYDTCDYICEGYPPKLINKNTDPWTYNFPNVINYDGKLTYYSGKDINTMVEQLRILFANCFTLTLNMIKILVDYGNTYFEEIILLRALSKLINDRVPILNRFGFVCYLKEDKNTYFLDSEYSIDVSYMDRIYTETPRVSQKTLLSSLIEINQLEEDERKILRKGRGFCKAGDVDILKNLHFRSLIAVVEEAFEMLDKEKKLTSKQKEILKEVIKTYGQNLITMKNGTTTHTLYASEYTGVGYHTVEKDLVVTGSRRVYDPKYKLWYTASEKEEGEIVKEIKSTKEKGMKNIFDNIPYDIIGFEDQVTRRIDKPEYFKIRIKGSGKGQVCMTKKIDDPQGGGIKQLFVELYLKHKDATILPKVPDKLKNISRKVLLQRLNNIKSESIEDEKILNMVDLESASDRELAGLLHLFKGLNKAGMCVTLREWLEAKNIFFDQ